MTTRARVSSVEAIESFRTSLLLYLTKAKPALEEVQGEVTRTRVWVQYTQRTHWEAAQRHWERELEEARGAVLSAKMSAKGESADERMRLAKAKRGMEIAVEKLKVLKRWDREFDNRTDPCVRQLEKLHGVLTDDLGKGLVYLTRAIETLHQYAAALAPTANEAIKTPMTLKAAVEEVEKISEAEPVKIKVAKPEELA